MIRKLRRRARADNHRNQPRRRSNAWSRQLYLLLLLGFLGGLANYAWGDRVRFEADGLLLRERTVIAATALVRVDRIAVRPGELVQAGQPLLSTASGEALRTLANHALRFAEMEERDASLAGRRTLALRLEPLAAARMEATLAERDQLAALAERGLVSLERLAAAERAAYQAEAEAARLAAELQALDEEIAARGESRRLAEDAFQRLSAHYDAGLVRAPVSGVVGDAAPAVGEVFAPGAPLLTITSGAPYVLAYLPETYAPAIEVGARVALSGGRAATEGRIAEILPLSTSVPEEFRTAFRPGRSRRLARIEIPSDADIPVFSTVRISRPLEDDLRAFAGRLVTLVEPGANAVQALASALRREASGG